MPRRTILVDGYNLIGVSRRLRAHDLERAREAILDRMRTYARARGHEVVVFFDGADLPVDYYPRKSRMGVRAVFSEPGEKADAVIVAWAQRLKGQCVVVTNDRAVRRGCEEAQAVVLSCEEFERYVSRALRAPKKSLDRLGQTPEAIPEESYEEGDLDAWQRFTAGVKPLADRDSSPRPREPSTPEIPPQEVALLTALTDVPDAVARQRAQDDLPTPPLHHEQTRRARRIRNVLNDL